MKNKFISLFLSFLLWNFASAMVQTVYTIQNCTQYVDADTKVSMPDVYWVPITGDSVLVKVKLKSAVPVIIQTGGNFVPNFAYVSPYLDDPNKEMLPVGLFCFQKDITEKLNGEYILRDFKQPIFTFIWSSRDKAYCGYSLQLDPKKPWRRSYDPAGKDPSPFVFKVKNATTGESGELTLPFDTRPGGFVASTVPSGTNELKSSLDKLAGNLKTLKTKLKSLSDKLNLLKSGLAKAGTITPASKSVPAAKGNLTVGEAVDEIFKKANDLVEVSNASADLVDNSTEIKALFEDGFEGFNIKIQSMVHLNWLKQQNAKTWKDNVLFRDVKTVDDVIECASRVPDQKQYLKIVKNAFANEMKNSDYYVFYHAYSGGLRTILYEIYQFLYSWGMLQRNQPLALRFLDKDMTNMGGTGDLAGFRELMNNNVHCQTGVKTKENKMTWCWYEQPGHVKEENECPDQIPTFKNLLLSVNLALFGNDSIDVERTFSYFTGSKSVSKLKEDDKQAIINKIASQLPIADKFKEKINEIIKKHEKELGDEKTGTLLQIFITKDVVDRVAYHALAGGYNIDKKYYNFGITVASFEPKVLKRLEENFPKLKEFNQSISKLLIEYINNPEKLNDILGPYQHSIHLEKYSLSLDTLQARIWLASPCLYNPECTKIIRYSTLDPDVFKKLHDDLTAAFAELIKEFIKQKVQDKKNKTKIVDPEKLPKAFKNLNKFIDDQLAPITLVKNEISWLPVFAQAQTV